MEQLEKLKNIIVNWKKNDLFTQGLVKSKICSFKSDHNHHHKITVVVLLWYIRMLTVGYKHQIWDKILPVKVTSAWGRGLCFLGSNRYSIISFKAECTTFNVPVNHSRCIKLPRHWPWKERFNVRTSPSDQALVLGWRLE